MVPYVRGSNITFNLVEVRDYMNIFIKKEEFEDEVAKLLEQRLEVPENFVTELKVLDGERGAEL